METSMITTLVCLALLVSIHTAQADDLFGGSQSAEDVFARSLEPHEESQGRSLGALESPFARSLGPVEDAFARSLGARYIGNGMHLKGGWRPVMTSGSGPFIADGTHKIFSGPGHLENKAYNVHGFGASAHGSTSTRPLSTRDVNKISNIAQTYKPSVYPQNGVNLNAPVSSYLNPFAFTSNAALNPYKHAPGFHFDNNVFHKQATSHRPLYTKQPQPQQQLLLGMRVKPNQYQILAQHPNNHFHQHQQLPSYQQQMKKPIESYSRPADNHHHHMHQQNYLPKPNEHKPIVNPQESLHKQTQQVKPHQGQTVSAVTYKPPISNHFPQFGVNEDSFAPIPSSILGSFSSFGHASVKARDPPQFNKNQQVEPTKTPDVHPVTKDYVSSSTANAEIKVPKPTSNNIIHNYQPAGKEDYKSSLVPPPQIHKPTNEVQNGYTGSFIPSPVDPLTKGQNHADAFSQQSKYSSTKRPPVASFFDISPSTISPFESVSTHALPDNVQLPSPHAPFNAFGVQNSKVNIYKDKHQTYSTINHSPVTTKYYDDGPHFPQHELFDTKFHKHNLGPKPTHHSYEVTEGWEPFGEDGGTQPSLNTWGNPSQTFKQYTSVLGPPHNNLNKIVPTFYPQLSSNIPDLNSYNDVSTIYSVVSENQQHSYENSLTSPDPQDEENSDQSNKQIVISPSPNYININTDKGKTTTTDFYQDTTTIPSVYNHRRKPSRYRPQQETTTEDFKDTTTTRFETFKENGQETSNDLVANDFPTIPPNKHFKRPSLTTTPPHTADDVDKYKRNKNRRRRPQKTATSNNDETTEEIASESIFKAQRERTTTFLPEVEETTKLPRSRLRFPQKSRPTRPSAQPELTSSAQPTVIPTHPVTLRPKLHSRIRTTTQSPLDFDEMVETTTIKDKNFKTHEKQSSIMKIAKDNTLHRPLVNKYSASFGSINDTPDYSHKQDEKDTPTSDISLYLSDNKYSSKKENNISFSDLFMDFDSEVQQTAQDSFLSPTAAQPTEQVEAQPTQLALDDLKSPYDTKNNEEILSPSEGDNNKKTKLYGNRPRFSVKDYRNRLNQYTSSTTEKPQHSTDASPRLRFPNRAKLTNLKDRDYHDSKTAGSDVENVTEVQKKKFVPKESKHKLNNENSGLQQKNNSSSDSDFALKANNKFRSSLRRDPNKLSTGTTVVPDVTEKSKQAPNLKRPVIRKRVQVSNRTTEATVEPIADTTTTTTTEKVNVVELAVETVQRSSSTEKSTSETAIMKIAKDDKKHSSTESSLDFDLSQRVSDLTLAASKDYDTPGMFKSVSPNSRRVVPNYFTIATDDPILPIEAFFPQLNQKKDS